MSKTCLICQTLATDPDEPQLHRLIRVYEAHINDLTNRLINLENTEKWLLEKTIRDQQQTIDRLNLIVQNRRKSA